MKKIILLFSILISTPLLAQINVVTTLPEFKWFIDELGKEEVKTVSLLSGHEDPHFIDAVPSFILKVSSADLLVLNGLELEVGWLPKVIQMAGNKKVNVQSDGYCDGSKGIKKAQVIKNYNRSMGDVHPAGNPHYSISVFQMKKVAKTLKDCLSKVKPDKKAVFEKNYQSLIKKLSLLEQRLNNKAKLLKDTHFMSYHLEFVYFFSDLKLKSFGTLEKVPGILPSAAQLLEKATQAKKDKVNLVLAGKTNPEKYLEKFKESTKIDYLQIDLHMTSDYENYITYQETLLSAIIKYANKNK